MKTYSVKEIFGPTIQGEGYWAGHVAVFVRLAGCNMWSGREEDRERDAERNRAHCPRWCDTDFVDGHKMTAAEISQVVKDIIGPRSSSIMVVISGGEPLLQVDAALIDALIPGVRMVAIETNGTVEVPLGISGRCWITCSPKQAPEELRISPRTVNELKVVFPDYDPLLYEAWSKNCIGALYVQPEADTSGVGVSVIDRDITERAVRFVLANPRWALSMQTHKICNVP